MLASIQYLKSLFDLTTGKSEFGITTVIFNVRAFELQSGKSLLLATIKPDNVKLYSTLRECYRFDKIYID